MSKTNQQEGEGVTSKLHEVQMRVTETEIVERAVKDAIKGGLSKLDVVAMLPPGHTNQHILVMMYDHRFLKGLWGEHDIEDNKTNSPYIWECSKCGDAYSEIEGNTYDNVADSCWEYHGIKAFLSGDPIAYIAKNKYGAERIR